MEKIFTKIVGTSTSIKSDSIVDSEAKFTPNFYKGWFCIINNNEHLILSNSETEIFFSNNYSDVVDYSLHFVSRGFLAEIESDAANNVLIPDDLISNKYNQTNSDIHSKVYSNLKHLIRSDFDPLKNIKNLTCLQQVFAYYMLSKIYQDLSIDQDSFETFKGFNMYEKSYKDGIGDAISSLQIDLNQDSDIDSAESQSQFGKVSFFSSW